MAFPNEIRPELELTFCPCLPILAHFPALHTTFTLQRSEVLHLLKRQNRNFRSMPEMTVTQEQAPLELLLIPEHPAKPALTRRSFKIGDTGVTKERNVYKTTIQAGKHRVGRGQNPLQIMRAKMAANDAERWKIPRSFLGLSERL